MSSYFARVSFKAAPESKDQYIGGTAVEGRKPLYEVVYEKDAGEVTHLRTGKMPNRHFLMQRTSTKKVMRRVATNWPPG